MNDIESYTSYMDSSDDVDLELFINMPTKKETI